MLKFGFEREFFVTTPGGKPVVVPSSIPNDAGLLAEARAEPSKDPIQAAFNLKAEVYRIQRKAEAEGLVLSDADVMVIPQELRIKARRSHTKDLIHYQNLYGHERHPVEQDEMTAGIHVSVTRLKTFRFRGCSECEGDSQDHNVMFDFARMVTEFDKTYAAEIERAGRLPGFYEIKSDGRVEYRSLPQSVDILNVAEFIKHNTSAIHGSWS